MYNDTRFECKVDYFSYKENCTYQNKLKIKLEESCTINRQYFYTETDENGYFSTDWYVIDIEKLKQNNLKLTNKEFKMVKYIINKMWEKYCEFYLS